MSHVSPKRPDSLALHRLHVSRARKVMRARLAEDLDLETIARAAGASVFHFARLYAAFTGETVFEYRARLRMREAATRLCEDPSAPIAAVALDVGYGTASSFNKAFRRALGVSPSELRARSTIERSAAIASLSSPASGAPEVPASAFRLSGEPVLRTFDPRRFVRVRERGPYAEVAPLAWAELVAKLTAARVDFRAYLCIGASYDDPQAVREEDLRYDAGIVVDTEIAPPPGTEADELPGGAYAVFAYRGPYRFINAGFARIFRDWLAASGFRARSGPCLEVYRDHARDESDRLTELCVPVVAVEAP